MQKASSQSFIQHRANPLLNSARIRAAGWSFADGNRCFYLCRERLSEQLALPTPSSVLDAARNTLTHTHTHTPCLCPCLQPVVKSAAPRCIRNGHCSADGKSTGTNSRCVSASRGVQCRQSSSRKRNTPAARREREAATPERFSPVSFYLQRRLAGGAVTRNGVWRILSELLSALQWVGMRISAQDHSEAVFQ